MKSLFLSYLNYCKMMKNLQIISNYFKAQILNFKKRLMNLTNTRKILINDIANNFTHKNMFEARVFFVDNILFSINVEDIQSVRNTIDDWIDMKNDVKSLAS
eukprot:529416_1